MNISSPESIIFWTTLVFVLLLVLLRKYAWKPILNSVKDRETSIKNALEAAEKARMEMDDLQADNKKLVKEAREERDQLLKEAREAKEKIIAEASGEADAKANEMITRAKEAIEAEKQSALADIKTQMAEISIQIAEKVIKKELDDKNDQMKLVDGMLKDVKLN